MSLSTFIIINDVEITIISIKHVLTGKIIPVNNRVCAKIIVFHFDLEVTAVDAGESDLHMSSY